MKSNDQVLLTLTERVTGKNYIVKIESKTVEAVKEGLRRIFSVMGDYKKIVKSITSDNGVEFSRLYELEEEEGMEVFYAHPYSSFERRTNENCNGIVWRKIPKSTYIKKYSDEDIRKVEQWVNDMPRKILGYRTANEFYEQELKKLGISA